MMYSNIVKELVFQYIEHGILRYDFVNDITMYLFQVLILLHWISEFSKIMIIIYFGHLFPLTSHIRGHLLSAKMALLHLSADIHHVGTQKDNLDWSGQNTIDVHELWCIIFIPALYIFILSFGLNTRLFALQLARHTWLCALQPTYTLHTWVPFEQQVCHTLTYVLMFHYNVNVLNMH